MKTKVKRYIAEHRLLAAGDNVLVGVSGGADSLALLYFLKHTYPQISVGAAHLHHGLRGKAADADEALVKAFCLQEQIPFYSCHKAIAQIARDTKMTLEEAGREARYAFFQELCQTYHYSVLALGHHCDDQAETILMHLIRGTGINGARGMLPDSERMGMRIIRPFLCVSKNEILEYCKEHQLRYCTDATNFENDVTRNKIRLEVMPILTSINANVSEHLAHFGEMASDYEAFLQEKAEKFFDEKISCEDDCVRICVQELAGENTLFIQAVFRLMIKKVKGSLKEIGYNHIKSIIEKLKSTDTCWSIDLPGKLTVTRRYTMLSVEKKKEASAGFGTYLLPVNCSVYLSKEHLKAVTCIEHQKNLKNIKESKNHSEKFFDYGKIRGKLFLRQRKAGDYFCPVGQTGQKKIKHYLIDKKIVREKRDMIPLLAEGSHILWIYGYAIDRLYRADEQTEEVLRIALTEIPRNKE